MNSEARFHDSKELYAPEKIASAELKKAKVKWIHAEDAPAGYAVLLDEFDRAVVADIGLGKMANADSTIASGQTPLWASPEQRLVSPLLTLLSLRPVNHT